MEKQKRSENRSTVHVSWRGATSATADPEQRRLASAIERMTKICDYINEYQQSNTKDK